MKLKDIIDTFVLDRAQLNIIVIKLLNELKQRDVKIVIP